MNEHEEQASLSYKGFAVTIVPVKARSRYEILHDYFRYSIEGPGLTFISLNTYAETRHAIDAAMRDIDCELEVRAAAAFREPVNAECP